jgi:hypothetical protein
MWGQELMFYICDTGISGICFILIYSVKYFDVAIAGIRSIVKIVVDEIGDWSVTGHAAK